MSSFLLSRSWLHDQNVYVLLSAHWIQQNCKVVVVWTWLTSWEFSGGGGTGDHSINCGQICRLQKSNCWRGWKTDSFMGFYLVWAFWCSLGSFFCWGCAILHLWIQSPLSEHLLRQEYSRCGKQMIHAWWCWLLWWLTSSLCMRWTQTWINIIFLMNLLHGKLSSQPKSVLLRVPKWLPLT